MNLSPKHPSPTPARTLPRRARGLLAGCAFVAASLASALSASGRSEDAQAAGRFVAAAPLLLHAGGAATALRPDAGQHEAGSSNAEATAFGADEDHCFVANHAIVNAADGRRHFIQVVFRKRGHGVALVRFGEDALGLVEQAHLAAPAAGRSVSVDVANHRIGFDHAVLGGAAGSVVLDGSFDFAPNTEPEARAACG